MITIINLQKYKLSIIILYIIIGKLSYLLRFCLVILLKLDKTLKIYFYYIF